MSTFKRWTALGVGAALIAGCSEQGQPAAPAADPATPASTAGEGEGGEGGESGEGGVDVAAAATDPVVFLSALALVEAHVRAAEAAAIAGERQAAAEMFAHPVSEVLVDIAPAFQILGVPSLDDRLIAASGAAAGGADEATVRRHTREILEALGAAEARAPQGGAANPDVAARVISDLIDRAALQYATARGSEAYESYLDGYGFRLTAEAWTEEEGAAVRRALPQAATAIDAALARVVAAYPQATRPETLSADPGALLAASSAVKLALSS